MKGKDGRAGRKYLSIIEMFVSCTHFGQIWINASIDSYGHPGQRSGLDVPQIQISLYPLEEYSGGGFGLFEQAILMKEFRRVDLGCG
jgi:hypothetical protein